MVRRMRWILIPLLISSFLIAPSVRAEGEPTDVNTQLSSLNDDFRGWYADRRTEILRRHPLILVVSNTGVTAIRPGQQASYLVDLTAYSQVKSVMHAVLGYQGLMRSTIAAGDSADWSKVERLVTQLKAARSLIPQTQIPDHLQPEVQAAIDKLIASGERAIDTRSITLVEVRRTLNQAREGVYPTVLWIGRKHAGDIKSVLQTVKRDVSTHEWQRAVAVVTGPMTPRRNNLETAVTARMLGADKLGRQIFYSENLFTTKDAVNYLGTVLGDAQFSRDMFNSATRMWRDLFSDVSRTYVARDFYTALAR
jgi:hypothetical protein